MILRLQDVGKRFNRHWIFRHVNHEFRSGRSYAITGPNGSGKSTLLHVIAGAMQHSEGSIHLSSDEGASGTIPAQDHYKHITIAAPYLELIEEFTLREFLQLHFRFKPELPGFDIEKVIATIGLQQAADKQIRYYSSGMKQRVKLAQAILCDVPIVLLDEPCTNLDLAGIELYHRLVKEHCGNRLLMVCSNDENEIAFCTDRLNITDHQQI